MKIYALSDIHGEYELLLENMKSIDLSNKENQVVFCGDYIDSGHKSCQTLLFIKEVQEKYPEQVIVLKGNHELLFFEWLEKEDSKEWFGGDRSRISIRSFLTPEQMKKIEHLLEWNYFVSASKVAKKYVNKNYPDLLEWGKSLPYFYETEQQIFVHGGINEDAKLNWKTETSPEEMCWKYPWTTGKFYKDIIAGHTATARISGQESYHEVYFDGESHYYIDGDVRKSGKIPLLVYDVEKKSYTW
ncbi:MAG: metallophosphoesterase [Lachnospiraceae bacterium]|nr:metallophosphoesterase [Lachnospiraceae bacterium]